MEKDEELASKVGADKYIRKPIEPQEFVKLIQGVFRDVEEGKVGPKKLVLEEEKEVLKLYSERLIAKLEKKMLDMERETAQRKQAQEEVEHLNKVLRAIRNVNQLIIKEKERDKLLKSSCDTLIETRSYDSACICLFDESGMLVTHAEAGLDKDFLPMVERLKRGELTDCIERTLIQSGVVITKVSSVTCGGCPLVKTCSGKKVVTVRMEHGGKVYGLLRLSLSGDASISGEEQSLLQEVTGDVAFALHNMELEKERKQAEESLRESEERFRALTESTSDWVWETDVNGVYTYANPKVKELLGYEPEEVIDKTPFDLMLPEEAKRIAEKFRDIVDSQRPFTGLENTNLHKDGRLIVMESSGVPCFDADGRLCGYRGIDRDITERKKMEEQLIVTDRLASIGELVSGVAHELNNPLTSIIGFSDLLADRKDLPDDVKEDLRVINREAQRTAGVVRNLLAFARKHKAAKQPTDINKAIEAVLELRAYEQKVSNIEVITRFAPDLPETTADGFQLQQVFLNIIINAEYFMTEAHGRGTLTITTERAGDTIRASFADDGPGIAKENLGHVFDPFFTTREVGKGTGLGLSISYGIITEHGGRVYAESELGKGATFAVELPINK